MFQCDNKNCESDVKFLYFDILLISIISLLFVLILHSTFIISLSTLNYSIADSPTYQTKINKNNINLFMYITYHYQYHQLLQVVLHALDVLSRISTPNLLI